MFRYIFGGLACTVALPFFAFAGAVAQCDSWDGNPPPSRQSADLQTEMKAAVNNLDLCADERVVMSVSFNLFSGAATYVQKGKTRGCSEADKQKYGCEKGKLPPKVCIEIPNIPGTVQGGKYEVSKCDQNALTTAVDRTAATKDTSSLKALAAQYKRGEPLTETVTPVPHPDTATIDRAITAASPDPETTKVLRADPKMIEAVASGDATKILERAEQLGVNADAAKKLADNAAKLAAPDRDTQGPPRNLFDVNGVPENTFACPGGNCRERDGDSPFGGDFAGMLSKMFGGGSPFGMLGKLFGMANGLGGSSGGSASTGSSGDVGRPANTGVPTAVGSPFGGARPVSDIIRDAIQSGGSAVSSQPGVVTIIAQPENVNIGRPVIVTWSSVRVSSDTCVISMSGVSTESRLARGDTGMHSVSTKNMSKGTLTFIVKCTSESGQSISDMDSVTLN